MIFISDITNHKIIPYCYHIIRHDWIQFDRCKVVHMCTHARTTDTVHTCMFTYTYLTTQHVGDMLVYCCRLWCHVVQLGGGVHTWYKSDVQDGCSKHYCYNGGTCKRVGNSALCRCRPQFSGSRCQGTQQVYVRLQSDVKLLWFLCHF